MWIIANRVDNEKIESLKSDFFGPAYSLTIKLKCKNVAGLVLIGCLVPEIASCFETQNTKKWDFAHILNYIEIEENEEILRHHLKLSGWSTAS